MLNKLKFFLNSYRIRLATMCEPTSNLNALSLKAGKDDATVRKQRVLVATSMGCYEHAVILESTIAKALQIRGAEVDFLLCDQVLPCCQMTKIYNVKPELLLSQGHTPRCKSCLTKSKSAFAKLDFEIIWFSSLIDEEYACRAKHMSDDIPAGDIGSFTFEGMAVGEHALAGALRFYARGDLVGEEQGEKILRRYLHASLLTAFAMERLLAKAKYDAAVFHHGIYVPQGIIGEVCRKHGVRVVNWNPAYRKHSFVFSHGDSYHHTMISEPTESWQRMDWDAGREQAIRHYLKSRWYGTDDWIWFHNEPVEDMEAIRRETGVDFSKPCIGLLTSVMWDAQLHYKSNAFPSMLAWTLQTIDYFRNRPDLQLVIRIHPAEKTGLIPSRQKMLDEIHRHIPELPPNVVVIPPESRISTYAVMSRCNAVIIYNTKTGIEIASMGIPVIVAGEAWIRNKGFSLDASSPADYFALLDRLPLEDRMRPEQVERATRYAYHFFFRRMIELPFIVPTDKGKYVLDLADPNALRPGNYKGLDVICNGILDGEPFVVD